MEHIFLLPGDYSVVEKPTQLGTLLGSCVSVCLSNPHRRIAAMNHFMLPCAERQTDIGRYGDTSIEELIKQLFAIDPDPRRYFARIFGGGAVMGHLGGSGGIGDRNVAMARRAMSQYGVRVVDEDVGGTSGRRVDFMTGDGVVDCRVVNDGKTRSGANGNRVRVLIIDDSPVVRRVLRRALDGADGIEVVGEAANPFEARAAILELNPDVMTLDIEMPKMDGLTFLRHLMDHFPKPVVIVSSLVEEGSPARAAALANGACGALDKKQLQMFTGPEGLRRTVVPLLKHAARTGPGGREHVAAEATRKGA